MITNDNEWYSSSSIRDLKFDYVNDECCLNSFWYDFFFKKKLHFRLIHSMIIILNDFYFYHSSFHSLSLSFVSPILSVHLLFWSHIIKMTSYKTAPFFKFFIISIINHYNQIIQINKCIYTSSESILYLFY